MRSARGVKTTGAFSAWFERAPDEGATFLAEVHMGACSTANTAGYNCARDSACFEKGKHVPLQPTRAVHACMRDNGRPRTHPRDHTCTPRTWHLYLGRGTPESTAGAE